MALRFEPSEFKSVPYAGSLVANLTDTIVWTGPPGPAPSLRSTGRTLIDSAPFQMQLDQRWQILTVSFQAYLAIQSSAPAYGLLGKLIAGIFIDPSVPPVTPRGGSPLQPFPTDTSLITTLWDGANDRTPTSFPIGSSPTDTTNLVITTGSVALPISKQLVPGQQIGVGLWLTQSLVGRGSGSATVWQMLVLNSTYSAALDD